MKTQPVRIEKSLHEALMDISNNTRPRVGIQALADEAIRRMVEDVRAHGLNILRETEHTEPTVAPATAEPYKIGPKNRLGTKRSAPPVMKVQPGMDITIR